MKEHIDLAHLKSPMEELASVRENSNLSEEALVTETKVLVLAANIATYSLRPETLISTIQ